jgi:hypothetical protein
VKRVFQRLAFGDADSQSVFSWMQNMFQIENRRYPPGTRRADKSWPFT